MLHSWIDAAARLGCEFVLACPPGYGPDASMLGIPSVGRRWPGARASAIAPRHGAVHFVAPPLVSAPRTAAIRALPLLLAILGAAAALGATAYRLHFGLHFEDESCYVAEPLRFVLGDRVFVDDLDVRQLSALLLVPFVWLYVTVTGGSDGIMLFTRGLYLLYGIGVAGVVLHVLRGHMPGIAAGFTALVCAVYAHFNIFNLSYNSMGSGFLVVGSMLGIAGVAGTRRPLPHLLLSGVAHGLAVVSYPTLVVVAAGFTALLAWSLPRPRRRGMLAFALGAAAVAVPFAGLLLHAGLDHVREALDFTRAWGTAYGSEIAGGTGKLRLLRSQLPLIASPFAIAAVLSAILLILGRVTPAAGVVLAPLLAVPPFISGLRDENTAMGFVIVFGLLAPGFCWALRKRAFVRTLFVLGWLPSLAAGVTAAWSSTNGLANAAVGLLPACLITNVVVVLWASERAAVSGGRLLRGMAMLTPVVTVAGIVSCQYAGRTVYPGEPLSALRFTLQAGPFRGIVTSQRKFTILTNLAADLPKLVNPDGKILCYPHFAAGYLMTSMRPASPHCWVGGIFDRHARWYAERANPDDVIVRLKHPDPALQPLDEVALRNHRLLIDRPGYAIYTRAP